VRAARGAVRPEPVGELAEHDPVAGGGLGGARARLDPVPVLHGRGDGHGERVDVRLAEERGRRHVAGDDRDGGQVGSRHDHGRPGGAPVLGAGALARGHGGR